MNDLYQLDIREIKVDWRERRKEYKFKKLVEKKFDVKRERKDKSEWRPSGR